MLPQSINLKTLIVFNIMQNPVLFSVVCWFLKVLLFMLYYIKTYFQWHTLLYFWLYIGRCKKLLAVCVWMWGIIQNSSRPECVFVILLQTFRLYYFLLQELERLAHDCEVIWCLRCPSTATVVNLCVLESYLRLYELCVAVSGSGFDLSSMWRLLSQKYSVISLSCCAKFFFCFLLYFTDFFFQCFVCSDSHYFCVEV